MTPYLDTGVWEFLMSLPASLLLDHRFHIETIRAAHPSVADVPYARKLTLPAREQRTRGRTMLPLLWRRLVREPSPRILKAIGHAIRAATTGRGYPGVLLEILVYSEAVTAALRRCAPLAADAAILEARVR